MNNLNAHQVSQVKHSRMESAVGIVPKTNGAALALKNPSRRVWVGGTGTLVCTFIDTSTGTIAGIPSGTMLEICVTDIAASSTATNVVALV